MHYSKRTDKKEASAQQVAFAFAFPFRNLHSDA